MKAIFYFGISFLLVCTQIMANSLENERFAIHSKFGYLINTHSANFSKFQGSADCGDYNDGNGNGFIGGLFFEKPISSRMFAGVGFSIANRSADLKSFNRVAIRNLSTNKIEFAQMENVLSTKLSYFELQPDFRITLIRNLYGGPLRLAGSIRLCIPISGTFEQYERINEPDGAVFIGNDGRRSKIRSIADNDITTLNKLLYGFSFGFDNLLKIGNNSHLTQQLLFDFSFNDITSDANWNYTSIRFEVGLRYSLKNKAEVINFEPAPPPLPEIDVETIADLPLEKKLAVDNIHFVGNVDIGNELLATVPLVNSIFFGANQSDIPDIYYLDKSKEINIFKNDAIDYHYYILPRVVAIIEKNPNARINLESSTSGLENEPLGEKLAEKRAEAVKNKLVQMGVDPKIISINARLSPRFPSNQDFTEGIAENRRVDILLENAPMQEYVDLQKYKQITGNIIFDINYENYPENATLTAFNRFGESILIEKPGTYSLPVQIRIDEQEKSIEQSISILHSNDSHTFPITINISELEENIVELYLNNFEAILRFDYNSSNLSDDNKALLRQLINRLPAGSTIEIIGSADALGTEERNRILSQERASVTRNFIESISGEKFILRTGATNTLKFEESTNQGRFLNRSIRINVR